MTHPELMPILLIPGAIAGVLFIGFVIFLLIDKNKVLNNLVFTYIIVGIVSCVLYGFMHNIFVNPIYFHSLMKFDFSSLEVQAFYVVWGWRATVYFLVFSVWARKLFKNAKDFKDKSKLIKIILIQGGLLSTAWILDFEKLYITGGVINLHHILHWVGGIIGSLMFTLLILFALEKKLMKYLAIQKPVIKIKRKFMFFIVGIGFLLVISMFGLVAGCTGIDTPELLMFKLTVYSILFLIPLLYIVSKIARDFSDNLAEAVNFLKHAANQDYSSSFVIKSPDEFADLGSSLTSLKHNFMHVMSTVQDTANGVEESGLKMEGLIETFSSKVNVHFEDLIEMTDTQSKTTATANNAVIEMSNKINTIETTIKTQNRLMTENSSSIEEMTSNIQNISQRTASATQIVQDLYSVSEQGKGLIEKTLSGIKEIEETSGKIREINSVIDDISSQIGVLAMNAAIEASHAGVAGRGFAIVAQEMRNLSKATTDHAKTISSLVVEILEKVDHTSLVMEESKESFLHIHSQVTDTRTITEEISSAMLQQNSTLESILGSTIQLVDMSKDVETSCNAINDENLNMQVTFKSLEKIAMEESASAIDSESFVVNSLREILLAVKNNQENINRLKEMVLTFKLDKEPELAVKPAAIFIEN